MSVFLAVRQIGLVQIGKEPVRGSVDVWSVIGEMARVVGVFQWRIVAASS
jgi:hypothetical protein